MASLPQTPSFRLDGKRALVTGAGRGLGIGAAAALAQAGAHVTLVARTAPEIKAIAAAITEQGGKADTLTLDVTDIAAVKAALAERDPYHILVNNAGTNRPSTISDISEENYDLVTDLNVKAAIFVAQIVTDRLLSEGLPGSIINMSSQMGHVGGPKRTVYCATKHALEGATKAMALELGPNGIRVNSLAPTFVRTPMTEAMLDDPDFQNFVLGNIALGRMADVEDIMGAVVFLASDASAMVTGTSLVVDGGWTAA